MDMMQLQRLEYTDEVAKATAPLYRHVSSMYREDHWKALAPYVFEINRLKKEKNAVILAHNYMTPDIFHCVGDILGDSLKLAQEAAKTDADIIVQAGVHFMAETSKILCPEKTVLIPDMKAGCSLAESITGADVRLLREKYPGVPIVTYVNTSAEVKAESDVCCTSGNAVKIVEALNVPEVLMIPDQYLAAYVAGRLPHVKVRTWKGQCEVHERFTGADLKKIRAQDPKVTIIAHPECPPDVLAEADYTGSTAQMIDYVVAKQPPKVVLITECSMGDNISQANPNVEFVRACHMCPHMKRITLPKILHSLQHMEHRVEVDPVISAKAKKAVDAMLELSK
jgi:quinolinate synthase